MSSDESVAAILERLKLGDEKAASEIWTRCYPRVLALAKKRLERTRNKIADEEDVALSAIKSFCRAAQQGRFPDLQDQSGLWRILLKITSRKVIDLQRYESRRPAVEASKVQIGDSSIDGLANVPARISEDHFAQWLIEEIEQKLVGMDAQLGQLTLAKLEGYTNREIAEMFGLTLRTVERRLNLVRKRWSVPEQLDDLFECVEDVTLELLLDQYRDTANVDKQRSSWRAVWSSRCPIPKGATPPFPNFR